MEGVLEVIFFMGFLYWIYPNFFTEGVSRLNKMVDVVTNRMFDTFNRLTPGDHSNQDSLSTITRLKRFSTDQRYKRVVNRQAEMRARDNQLFEIKENVPEVTIPKRRPLMGLSCQGCAPVSRNSLVNRTTEQLALKNILDFKPPCRKRSLLHRAFPQLMQVYDFKRFVYPQVAQQVLKDARVRHAIETTAVQQFQDSGNADDDFYQELLKSNERRARKLLEDMRSTLSDFLLKFTTWVLYKLLPCFLSAVVVHPGQVQMLKEAGNSSLPLIFLPLHRSHLDYILISFILLNNNVRAPLVAAGDNLRIPFFGSLLRGLGAFFIKRRVDPILGRKDFVYKAVLHTYMNECLKAGHNMEFFLEGGRTRTGKPCMPKYGILSVIVDSFMDGTIEDALLVPVSVNYERLVDGNFVREQLGQPKEMETFSSAIRGIWHVLNSDYGTMRIDFNQPFSLRELVKTFNANGKVPPSVPAKRPLKSNPSTTSLYGTDVVSDEHKSLVECISKHVLFDCAKSTSVMSTNALAFILLHRYRKGATVEELVEALDGLRQELASCGRDIGFSGDSIDVLNYSIEMLGPGLVRKERVNNEEIVKPISILPNVIELSYYSNTVNTFYAMESMVAMALHSLDLSSGCVAQPDLLQATLELCNILQYEYIFCKPCQNLDAMILDCIDSLIIRKDIFRIKNEDTIEMQKSRRIAHEYFDEPEENSSVLVYEINNEPDVQAYLKFLRGVLMPLIEAYVVTAFCLDKLVGRELLESELIREILEEMKRRLGDNLLSYEESVAMDPVKNALKLFQSLGILECHAEKKLRLYYLKENQDDSDCVTELYNKINKYRTDREK